MSNKIQVLHFPILEYERACQIQEELRETITIREEDNTIMMLEHPPTITIGLRDNSSSNIFISKEECKKKGITIAKTSRGGDVTFHSPGQLIIYPIINLKDFNLKIVNYVDLLEQTIISTMNTFQIAGTTNEKHRGVWVNNAKLASIGINIKKYVTMHGIALNINNDLTYFNLINPCGLNKPITSMQKILNHQVDINDVKEEWLKNFARATDSNLYSGKA